MKHVVSDEIGGAIVYFQSVDDEDLVFEMPSGSAYGAIPTDARDKVREAYEQAKVIVKTVATDMGATLNTLSAGGDGPESVEMTFGLAFSNKVSAWVFTTGGDVTIGVKIVWKRNPAQG